MAFGKSLARARAKVLAKSLGWAESRATLAAADAEVSRRKKAGLAAVREGLYRPDLEYKPDEKKSVYENGAKMALFESELEEHFAAKSLERSPSSARTAVTTESEEAQAEAILRGMPVMPPSRKPQVGKLDMERVKELETTMAEAQRQAEEAREQIRQERAAQDRQAKQAWTAKVDSNLMDEAAGKYMHVLHERGRKEREAAEVGRRLANQEIVDSRRGVPSRVDDRNAAFEGQLRAREERARQGGSAAHARAPTAHATSASTSSRLRAAGHAAKVLNQAVPRAVRSPYGRGVSPPPKPAPAAMHGRGAVVAPPGSADGRASSVRPLPQTEAVKRLPEPEDDEPPMPAMSNRAGLNAGFPPWTEPAWTSVALGARGGCSPAAMRSAAWSARPGGDDHLHRMHQLQSKLASRCVSDHYGSASYRPLPPRPPSSGAYWPRAKPAAAKLTMDADGRVPWWAKPSTSARSEAAMCIWESPAPPTSNRLYYPAASHRPLSRCPTNHTERPPSTKARPSAEERRAARARLYPPANTLLRPSPTISRAMQELEA